MPHELWNATLTDHLCSTRDLRAASLVCVAFCHHWGSFTALIGHALRHGDEVVLERAAQTVVSASTLFHPLRWQLLGGDAEDSVALAMQRVLPACLTTSALARVWDAKQVMLAGGFPRAMMVQALRGAHLPVPAVLSQEFGDYDLWFMGQDVPYMRTFIRYLNSFAGGDYAAKMLEHFCDKDLRLLNLMPNCWSDTHPIQCISMAERMKRAVHPMVQFDFTCTQIALVGPTPDVVLTPACAHSLLTGEMYHTRRLPGAEWPVVQALSDWVRTGKRSLVFSGAHKAWMLMRFFKYEKEQGYRDPTMTNDTRQRFAALMQQPDMQHYYARNHGNDPEYDDYIENRFQY